eukprot:m.20269 g.20269  ORF g.20269 m.20269 type:complete len:929 (-) comp3819_c0_seq1:89-2875(-)
MSELRNKLAFMNQEGPPGYVPGVGRGATGFTTRSDIGPARSAADAPDERHAKRDGEDASENLNESNYDKFSGYGGSLFASGPYDNEDIEADRVYDAIDMRQDERRKEHRERRELQELAKYRTERPKIQQQFADLKRQLEDVTEDEWDNIPDVADIGKKMPKRKRVEKFTDASELFVRMAAERSGTAGALDDRQQKYGGLQTPMPGTQTLMPSYSGDLDLGEIGRARNTMMGVKLDQVSDSVTGQTVVDPKSYVTDLNSLMPKNVGDIGDVKRGRMLLQSVRTTNPKHAPAWIASAGLEEVTGRIQAARNIIMKGCEECPNSEEIWLEAARLLPPEQAKAAIAQGARNVPKSVKIWICAAELESETDVKRRVFRKALEHVSDSVVLWKAAVDLESEENARILLGRAVECCPTSTELWLALANLETYEEAQKVLNRARKAIPSDRLIWIAGARLQEAAGHMERIDTLINRGITAIQKHMQIGQDQWSQEREEWIKEAENCEKQGSIATAAAIISNIVGRGVEEEDLKETWMEDADSLVARECYHCARAVYARALAKFSDDEDIWLRSAFFEKEHGTAQSLDEHLLQAVKHCPQAETLWLMAAKSQWLAGDVSQARRTLEEAFGANENSEDIWLAAVKLESENNEFERARLLLAGAREKAKTARVWMKSARLDWVLGNIDEAERVLSKAVELHPDFDKLWMMQGQIKAQCGDFDAARAMYTQGRRQCPQSIPLWRLAAQLEVKCGNFTKARAILDKARLRIPKCPELWYESIHVELAANLKANAEALLARALQDCPTSGLVWSLAIEMAPKPQRKTRSVDAHKKCENDPLVLLAIARFFVTERKISKARDWFHRTVKLSPDLGDAWAYYYKFELNHGTERQQEDVLAHCIAAEPHHGEVWQSISKDPANWRLSTKDILLLTAKELAAREMR